MKAVRHLFAQVAYLAAIVVACGPPQLDRTLAEELIRDHYQYPNIETVRITRGSGMIDNASSYQSLVNQGLISFRRPSSAYAYYEAGFAYRYLEFTGEGRKYDASGFPNRRSDEAVGAIREFREVTGIRFLNAESSEAEVDFTVTRSRVTPFGTFKGLREGEMKSYSLKMARYDDGWRVIAEEMPDNLTLDQFPALKSQMGIVAADPTKEHLSSELSWASFPTGTRYVGAKVDQLVIRDEPALTGRAISGLAENDFAELLEEGGTPVTVTLRGKEITAAWAKVKTRAGEVGWAFCGGLQALLLPNSLPSGYKLPVGANFEAPDFPYTCVGDFNGDQLTDCAWILEGIRGGWSVFLFFSNGNGRFSTFHAGGKGHFGVRSNEPYDLIMETGEAGTALCLYQQSRSGSIQEVQHLPTRHDFIKFGIFEVGMFGPYYYEPSKRKLTAYGWCDI